MRNETPIGSFKRTRGSSRGRCSAWVDSPAMNAARDDRGVAVRMGGAVALFLILAGQAQVTILDGSSMLAVTQSIVHHASLSVPPQLGVAGHDGVTYYSKYG